MATVYIELDQLDEEDFIGVVSNGKLKIKLKRDTYEPIKSYATNTPANNIATFVDTKEDRRKLQVQGNFGYLHLDFTCRVANLGATGTWRLPNNSPTPKSLIEVQVRNGATVWIEQGSRVIRWAGLQTGQRYVVDLLGFWE